MSHLQGFFVISRYISLYLSISRRISPYPAVSRRIPPYPAVSRYPSTQEHEADQHAAGEAILRVGAYRRTSSQHPESRRPRMTLKLHALERIAPYARAWLLSRSQRCPIKFQKVKSAKKEIQPIPFLLREG